MNSVPYEFVDRVISRVPSTLECSYLGTPWRKPTERVLTYELIVSNTHYRLKCSGKNACRRNFRCKFQRCGFNFDLTSWNPRLCVISRISLFQETAFGECFPLDNPTIDKLKRIVQNNKRLIDVLEGGLEEMCFEKIGCILNVVPAFCDIHIESGSLNPLLVCLMLKRPAVHLWVENLAPEYIGPIADAIRSGLLGGCTIMNDSTTIDSEYCRPVLDAIIERHPVHPPYALYANPPLYEIVKNLSIRHGNHTRYERSLAYTSRKFWPR